jgi:hypothetical protein
MSYYGSESYWYLIADANGLSGTEELPEGRTLVIPNAIANSVNNAETFKVYNEQEIIGSTSPEVRTLKKKKKWYQKLVQIIVIVIAIVAAVFTAGAALGLLGMMGAVGSLGAVGVAGAAFAGSVATAVGVTAGALSLATVALAAGIGAVAYAAANIVSQGLMIAAGLQDKFQWRQVTKAAGTGAISGAATAVGAGLAKWVTEINTANNVATAANGLTTTQQILIKGGVEVVKQFAQNGKITNYAGIVGAAMGVNGTTAAGLNIAEGAARGRGSNAMDWVNLASSAILGGERTGVANGELNWKYVAVQALGTLVVGGLMGEDAALAYAGQAIGDGITGTDYEKQRELELQARENAREDAMARAMGIPTESDPKPGVALSGGTVGNALGNSTVEVNWGGKGQQLAHSAQDAYNNPSADPDNMARARQFLDRNPMAANDIKDSSLLANTPSDDSDFLSAPAGMRWITFDGITAPENANAAAMVQNPDGTYSGAALVSSGGYDDEMARILQQANAPHYTSVGDTPLRVETFGVADSVPVGSNESIAEPTPSLGDQMWNVFQAWRHGQASAGTAADIAMRHVKDAVLPYSGAANRYGPTTLSDFAAGAGRRAWNTGLGMAQEMINATPLTRIASMLNGTSDAISASRVDIPDAQAKGAHFVDKANLFLGAVSGVGGLRNARLVGANTASSTLGRIESRFGGASREVGFVVDAETGQILTMARQPYGQTSSSFRFTPEQWSAAEGNWITHNHPSGLTLGIEDVAGAVSSGARGIRASTSTGTFELSFDKSFASAYRGDPGAAFGFLQSETNAIGKGIMADVRGGALAVPNGVTGLQYKGFLANEMWIRYANQNLGLQYTFIPR